MNIYYLKYASLDGLIKALKGRGIMLSNGKLSHGHSLQHLGDGKKLGLADGYHANLLSEKVYKFGTNDTKPNTPLKTFWVK